MDMQIELNPQGHHLTSLSRLAVELGGGWYHRSYETATFYVFPDGDYDCTCGWDDLNWDRVPHGEHCFHTEYESKQPLPQGDVLKAMYKKHGLLVGRGKTWWHGCALKCTCDQAFFADEQLVRNIAIFGQDGHKSNCLIERPNFYHAPSGFAISWHKHPLRGGRANRVIEPREFDLMITECIAAIARDPFFEPIGTPLPEIGKVGPSFIFKK